MVLVFRMRKDSDNKELFAKILEFFRARDLPDVNIGPFDDSLLEDEGVWMEHDSKDVLENIREKLITHLDQQKLTFINHFEGNV